MNNFIFKTAFSNNLSFKKSVPVIGPMGPTKWLMYLGKLKYFFLAVLLISCLPVVIPYIQAYSQTFSMMMIKWRWTDLSGDQNRPLSNS